MGRVSQYLLAQEACQDFEDACAEAQRMIDDLRAENALLRDKLDDLATYVRAVNANTANVLGKVGYPTDG